MKQLTYGSVCSGIEAASVAWEPLGFKPAWFAEIEDFPSRVLAHHYPKVANLGDMTKIASLVRAGLVDAPDILVGGTPCQAFSIAGLRAGLSDPRGQLTISYVDLADAIDEKRPGEECVIYWENVPGVLSSADNAFGCFLGLLAGESSELTPAPKPPDGKNSDFWKWVKNENKHVCRWPNVGCVYGPKRTIAWRVLDAQYFGVAQRRRRVFLVASARDGVDPAKLLFEFDGVRRDIAPSRTTGQTTAGTLAARTDGGGFPGTGFVCSGYVQPVAPTLRAGGNSTGGDRPPGTDVDTCETLVVCMAHGQGNAEISVGRSPTLTCNHGARSGDSKDEYIVPVCATAAIGFEPRFYTRGGTGGAPNDTSALTAQNRAGDSAPHVAISTTAPIAWSEELTPSIDLAGTIQYGGQGGRHDGVMTPSMTVRRLIPKECERLQGFRDNYTYVPIPSKGNKKYAADGPRYKALGNSMAVPCMRWLGIRLILTHPHLFNLEAMQ